MLDFGPGPVARCRWTQQSLWLWLWLPLIVSGLASCTSFAGLDDAPLFEEAPGTGGAAGTSGAGDVKSPPPVGLGMAASMSSDDPGDMPVSQPGSSTNPVDQGNPTLPSDAGQPGPPPRPSLPPDAGISGGALPGPPEPVEVPACVGLGLELDGATFAAARRVVENDFTLEAWIKTRETRLGANAFNGRALFDSDLVGMGNQSDFAVSVLNGGIAFTVGGPDTTVQGINPVTSDEWTHVAVTRRASNGQLQIIVNGTLEGMATAANRGPLNARPELALGGFSTTGKFIGAIDEVRIWNVVRGVAEVSADMHTALSGSQQGLVGYYRFEDQGEAQTADSSPMANTATLTGNPRYVSSSALCAPKQ